MWREKAESILSKVGWTRAGILQKNQFMFQKAQYQESDALIRNPGCGWYHLYTFDAAKTDEPLYLACEEEELVLLRIGIGAFSDKVIPESSLNWIRKILCFFQQKKKGMILRFAYDFEGKGLEREPGNIKTVQNHMRQLGAILQEFPGAIFAVQGIFVGNWGEMHGSRYLTPDGLQTLTDTMLEALGGICPLAVRKPVQWRTLTRNGTEQKKKQLTLFNDGIFGSETDLGTYGTVAPEAPEQKIRNREEELQWQDFVMRGKFCGGEVVADTGGAKKISAGEAQKDLEKMHISYLNHTYDLQILEQWEKEKQLETIGKRLGYRFVVENMELSPEKQTKKRSGRKDAVEEFWVQITIANKGFAELTEEADCYLESEAMRSVWMDTNPGIWRSGERTVLQQKISIPAVSGQKKLFLALYRRRDKRMIQFANKDTENGRVLLGTLIGKEQSEEIR